MVLSIGTLSTGTHEVTSSYYFNPLTQTHSINSLENVPLVSVNLKLSKELDVKMLTEVIKKIGNYIAISCVKGKSSDTASNYCDDYRDHSESCVQSNWNYCKRHLSNEEMEECNMLEKKLDPLKSLPPLSLNWISRGFNIDRGDIGLMRHVLDSVRKYYVLQLKQQKEDRVQ